MKKLIIALCVCMLLACTAFSAEPIETDAESSLTLQYRHDKVSFEGLLIQSYRVAEIFEDGSFALTGAFADYPVNIYGITSQTEWNTVASTLAAYAIADRIAPTCSGVTDPCGRVVFSNLLPGIYLTLSVSVENETEVLIFEEFLTTIPQTDEDGVHNYDVLAYPKSEKILPELAEYRIVKQWKDSGYWQNRPDDITVDIYCDGELFVTVELSAENNWTYCWSTELDGSVWTAVERDIAEDYTVTVVENGTTIIITNAYDDGQEPPPDTGDTTVLWPYVLAMCVSGTLLIALGLWRKRKET